MRMAVVQLDVEPAQRTLTFQRALAAIDAAAERDPAPDIILLPAFCDVPATLTTDKTIREWLAGPTVEACGQRARQWGVHVAAGLAERGEKKPFVTGIVLDVDGDVRLIQRQCDFRDGLPAYFARGENRATADTDLGRIAMLVGDDLLDGEAWAAAVRAGAAIIFGVAWWASGPAAAKLDAGSVRRRLAELAGLHGLVCAAADVVMAAGDTQWSFPGVSLIVDAGGRLVVSAEVGAAATLWGDVEIPPRSAAEENRR